LAKKIAASLPLQCIGPQTILKAARARLETTVMRCISGKTIEVFIVLAEPLTAVIVMMLMLAR
jgi:hypothetical protein